MFRNINVILECFVIQWKPVVSISDNSCQRMMLPADELRALQSILLILLACLSWLQAEPLKGIF